MDALSLIPILVACALPMAGATIMGFVQQLRERRTSGPELPQMAGRWLSALVSKRRMSVRVEVHPHTGIDAYFPGTGAIGLSQRTFASSGAVAYAVAAHELGHAENMAHSAFVADLLPTARLARTFAYRTFSASLIAAALFREPWLLVLATGFLVLSLCAGAVILGDEGMASKHGLAFLRADRCVGDDAVRIARRSMAGAFSVYAAAVVGELAVLLALPWLADLALTPAHDPLKAELWAPAVWGFVAFVPFLLLRAAHVLHRVFRPEPVTSDFRLFTVMHRESQWEFLAGVGVLLVVAGLHTHGDGALFQLSTVLATTTAVGPVGGLLRALVLVPVVLMLLKLGVMGADDEDIVMIPEAREADAAPALMALYTDPPWYLRVSWVTHVAYVPLLVLLIVQLSYA